MEQAKKAWTRTSKQIILRRVFVEVPNSENCESNRVVDLYRSVKPLVVLGRLFLIIPCGSTNSHTYKKRPLGWNKVPVVLSILISCWSLVELCVRIKAMIHANNKVDRGIVGYLHTSNDVIYSASASFAWIYFLLRSDKFYDLFAKWSGVCRQYKLTHDQNSLVKVSWLLLGLILPTGVVQALFNGNGLLNPKMWKDNAPLEDYYKTAMHGWIDMIPYSPVFAAFHWILMNMLSFPLLLLSPLIIFLSRAASSQFVALIETKIGSKVDNDLHNILGNRDKRFWEDLVSKYNGIVYLVTTVNTFLSPLLFFCVTCAVYMVCIQLFGAVFGSKSLPLPKEIFGYSFLVDVTWLFGTLLIVAQVQSDAFRILDVLKHCPMEYYESSGVARLENRVCSGPHIGFTGLSFYTITKGFMVTVVSAIFTIEIVLMQSAEAAGSSQSQPKCNPTI